MRTQNSRQFQFWLVLLTALSAALLGFIIVWLLADGALGLSRRRMVLGANDATSTPATTSRPRRTTTAAADLPTPTFVPLISETELPLAETFTPPPSESPLAEPPAETLPSPVPSSTSAPVARPTTPPAASVPPGAPAPPAAPVPVAGSRVRLDDSAWQGGYRSTRSYGGRSATWVYGTSTEYNTMQAAFTIERVPQGRVTLRVEGMDSEGPAKTPIQITVNGTPIFTGPNPLPNDDLPLESGTWASYGWSFDAGLLRPGQNVVRIQNQARGAFGLPPFFMLDYADLVLGAPGNNPPAPVRPTTAPTNVSPPVAPTPVPAPAPPAPEPPTDQPAPPANTSAQIRLDDAAWQGGYRSTRSYGGRSATWVYGTSTEYNTMQAAFTIERVPQGRVTLRVEGMDSEGPAKTPIQITVNGTPIFTGPNPLPNDDQPLESGTWASYNWGFDAGLLQPGQNVVRIQNQARGAFGLPPFFMLDYADVIVP